jgi:hypothetical protein
MSVSTCNYVYVLCVYYNIYIYIVVAHVYTLPCTIPLSCNTMPCFWGPVTPFCRFLTSGQNGIKLLKWQHIPSKDWLVSWEFQEIHLALTWGIHGYQWSQKGCQGFWVNPHNWDISKVTSWRAAPRRSSWMLLRRAGKTCKNKPAAIPKIMWETKCHKPTIWGW